MGWKLRYTGGKTKRKKSPSVPSAARGSDLVFETGVVYDIEPIEARRLMKEMGDALERVHPTDPAYASYRPTAEARRPSALRRLSDSVDPSTKLVLLKSLKGATVPGSGGDLITIPADTEVEMPSEQALGYMEMLPGVFEIVDRDS